MRFATLFALGSAVVPTSSSLIPRQTSNFPDLFLCLKTSCLSPNLQQNIKGCVMSNASTNTTSLDSVCFCLVAFDLGEVKNVIPDSAASCLGQNCYLPNVTASEIRDELQVQCSSFKSPVTPPPVPPRLTVTGQSTIVSQSTIFSQSASFVPPPPSSTSSNGPRVTTSKATHCGANAFIGIGAVFGVIALTL